MNKAFLSKRTLLKTSFFVTALSFIGCKEENLLKSHDVLGNHMNASAEVANYYRNVAMDQATFASIQSDLSNNQKARTLMSTSVTNKANSALSVNPSPVTSVEVTGGEDKAVDDAAHVYFLGLQYFLFQDASNANVYLNKARDFLVAWANVGNSASWHTPREAAYNKMIIGYSLVREKLSISDRVLIDNWLKKKFDSLVKYQIWESNWESAKLINLIQIAVALDDSARISSAKELIYNHLDKSYRGDGATRDFIGRDAFAYHVYELQYIAQILRTLSINDGRSILNNLIFKRSNSWRDNDYHKTDVPNRGGSLADAIYFMEPYVLDPVNNPHLEFVGSLNGPDKSRGDANKQYQSSASTYAFVEMAFILPNEVTSFIKKTDPTFDKYSNLNYYLNSFTDVRTNPHSKDIVVYSEGKFRGRSVTLGIGKYNISSMNSKGIANDDISSISIGKGLKVTLYEDNNYEGNSVILTKYFGDLGKIEFDNKISSIVIEELKPNEVVVNPVPFLYTTLYSNINLSGSPVSLKPGAYTLSKLESLGLKNNDASSIKIEKGLKVTLFDEDNFMGANMVLTESASYLSSFGFNDKTTSVIVENVINPDTRSVTVYSDISHAGNPVTLKPGSYTTAALQKMGVKNNDISSAKISKGLKVTFYDGDSLTGEKLVLTESATHFTNLKFNDKTSSILIETL